MDEINLSVVRQSFGNCVYNWKVHEVSAERCEGHSIKITLINLLLVGLVLGTLISQFFLPEDSKLHVAGTILTGVEILFLIFQLSFKFDERANQHKLSAKKFRLIRERYMLLIADIISENPSNEEVVIRRNELSSEMQTISELSPSTDRKAYNIARERLRILERKGAFFRLVEAICSIFKKTETIGEDFTISNEEIDRFLPENLRRLN